jgi:hypothetical protein
MINRSAFVVLGAVTLAACSGPAELSVSEEAGLEDKLEVVPEVLNRLQVGEETIEFARVDDAGESAFLLIDKGPIHVRWGALDRVLTVGEELTVLEQFFALAPEHEIPHPALVEFHELQTAALGRADAAIHRPELGPDPVLEKTNIAGCKASIFPASENPWFDVAQRGPSTSEVICTMGGLCNQFTRAEMVVGTCALGADGQFGGATWGYGYKSQNERDFHHAAGGLLGVNQKVRVYWQGAFGAGADNARMLSIDSTVIAGSLTVSVHSATRVGPIVP